MDRLEESPAGAPPPRVPRILAWALWCLTLALVAASAVLVPLDVPVLHNGAFVVAPLFLIAMVYATVGGLIGARLPRNPIGWLLCAIGLDLIIGEFVELYALRGLASAPGSLPAPRTLASLFNWTPVFLMASLVLLFLLFPDGRPPSRRWRPLVWIAVAVAVVGPAGYALERVDVSGLTNSLVDAKVAFPSTIGITGTNGLIGAILVVAGVLGLVTGLAALVGLFVRRRLGSPELRQQLAWLGYVGITFVVLLGSLLAYGAIAHPPDKEAVSTILFVLAVSSLVLGIPIACGIAVLHYRLYELDVVVKKTVVFGALLALFTAVYVGIVVGIGAAIGHRSNAALTFAAAALVALAFQPFRARARRLADRLVYGHRATPYEVLSTFADRVAGTYSTEDVLPRMAQTLGAATGARRAEVWLRVGSEYRLAARWPADDGPSQRIPAGGEGLPAFPGVDGASPVLDRDELLGALAVAMPPEEPLGGSKEKLIRDLASQAGLVLRNVGLIEELRASRERLVSAQDEERRRLERNIHDGAQQQLVALSVRVRLVQSFLRRDVDQAEQMLAQAQHDLGEAVETLRELARGIYPPVLADRGLAEALRGQVRKAALPVEIDADGIDRYPQNDEAAVYFCCLEALQNVAKYAEATRAVVRLREEDGTLRFSVQDDGRGFDVGASRTGTGVQGMADRLEALGGSLEIKSTPGEGTVVIGRLPLRR
jgi:signal transduction histidine kinase